MNSQVRKRRTFLLRSELKRKFSVIIPSTTAVTTVSPGSLPDPELLEKTLETTRFNNRSISQSPEYEFSEAIEGEEPAFSPVFSTGEPLLEGLPEEREVEDPENAPAVTRRSTRIQVRKKDSGIASMRNVKGKRPFKCIKPQPQERLRRRKTAGCRLPQQKSNPVVRNNQPRGSKASTRSSKQKALSNNSGEAGLTSEQEVWLVSYVASHPLVASGNYWATAVAAYPAKFGTKPSHLSLQRSWMLIASRMFADIPNDECPQPAFGNNGDVEEGELREVEVGAGDDGYGDDTRGDGHFSEDETSRSTTDTPKPKNPWVYTTDQLRWMFSHLPAVETSLAKDSEGLQEWYNATKSFNDKFNQRRSIEQLHNRYREAIFDAEITRAQTMGSTQASELPVHLGDLAHFVRAPGTFLRWSLEQLKWLSENECHFQRPDGRSTDIINLTKGFAAHFGIARNKRSIAYQLKRHKAKKQML